MSFNTSTQPMITFNRLGNGSIPVYPSHNPTDRPAKLFNALVLTLGLSAVASHYVPPQNSIEVVSDAGRRAEALGLTSRSLQELQERISAELSDNPLEDGQSSVASPALELALSKRGGLDWFYGQTLRRNGSEYIKLAGLVQNLSSEQRLYILKTALKSVDASIRDAAIFACDSWCDKDLLPTLKEHKESVKWVKDYLDQVIEDLEDA